MTDDEVHSKLVRWLHSTTGVTVIKANQSGPEPTEPFIVANLIGVDEVRKWAGSTEFTEDSSGVTETPVIETQWRFSIHAYGPLPTSILRPLRSAAQVPQAQEPLMPELVISEISTIRNIPDWVNESWRPRANIDLFLRGLTRDEINIDTIEQGSFVIEGTHANPEGGPNGQTAV